MYKALDLILANTVDQLLNKSSATKINDLRKPGAVIGFYFSASWCEHSMAFTQLLISFYEDINKKIDTEKLINIKLFEIVFVSSDGDEHSYKESIKDVPWLSISYHCHTLRKKLQKRFSVKEIPYLVLVDGFTEELITTQGKDFLSEDLNGDNFPWRPKSLIDLLSTNLLLKNKQLIDIQEDIRDSDYRGIYFSAHWCPPCRLFTPVLINIYNKLKERGVKFEIIFISLDRSLESFQEYSHSMPWYVLNYQDNRIKVLTKQFQVEGIPRLIILNKNDRVVCEDARQAVYSDLEAMRFPWIPKLVDQLNETNVHDFQTYPCLVLFTGNGRSDLIDNASIWLNGPAEKYFSERNKNLNYLGELPVLKFFYEGNQSDEVADSIRAYAQIDGKAPLLAIVDISQQKVFTDPADEIDQQIVQDLIEKFKKFVSEVGNNMD
ncbi:hypothetical protein HELRODRAFT_77825 [Helobdella robusta]|uniref:Thioredoxin domain-containing protein n=1 Tax=Helobdella robusta TaxID=6412 RepID=T1G346_HELRO|nr:hypothetical protein HELRODRAFT_77825 [Helobdella robusta]ESO05363.1 hypothetical protein HELRODRAFT_77825 [Helobdella robusta]